MKKIIAFEWLSLDGFIGGPNGETDWFVWDQEMKNLQKNINPKLIRCYLAELLMK